MLELNKVKILYIGVRTFGYERAIKEALEKMGALVDYYDERPANNFLTKVLLRLKCKSLIWRKINSYYAKILDEIKDIEYDYVFIVKLETIDEKILQKLKHNQKNATFILYSWDSLQNYRDKEILLPLFDRAFSFDKRDTIKYEKLNFLPLFYIPLYANTSIAKNEMVYDLCFIGTGHSDRYAIVKEIENKIEKSELKIYSFFYLQSKIIFLIRKIFDKKMREAKMSDFSFSSLSQKQVLDKILKTNVIIDIEHERQTGLTMRTIEALGCRKKLITTNANIKEYDFYNENNICIINRNNITIDKDFFLSKYNELDKKIYEKYSLQSWLKTIFSRKKLINDGVI